MTNERIVEERTQRLISLFKTSPSVKIPVIIAGIAVLIAILGYVRFLAIAAPFTFLLLAVASLATAALFAFKKDKWALYPLLAWVVYLAMFIRTRNLGGLRDVTTGGWTLGPDLDPFLFLRWAKDIVAHGSLPAMDTLRYVPLGFNTTGETLLLPYLIAWFHNITSAIGLTTSVEHSAVLFPVFMFGLTVIAFYFMVREVFSYQGKTASSVTALIASMFLSIFTVFLPRTIAGIPEKESAAFFFMFLALYLFLVSWKKEKMLTSLILAGVAGIVSALMALVWGGYVYLFVLVGLTTFAMFLAGASEKKHAYDYIVWLAATVIIMLVASTRYNLRDMLSSTTTGLAFAVAGILIVDMILAYFFKEGMMRPNFLNKVPRQIVSIVIAVIIGIILGTILIGPSFLGDRISSIENILVKPTTDRIGTTVAENKQPYLNEWVSSFGPTFGEVGNLFGKSIQAASLNNFPFLFWLALIGAVYLFYQGTKHLKKSHHRYLTASYAFLLLAIVFSRISESSLFNGVNFASTLFYGAGILIFLGVAGYVYYVDYRDNQLGSIKVISMITFFLALFFVVTLVSARGAIRLVMMLVPIIAMLVAALATEVYARYVRKRHENVPWQTAAVIMGVVFVIATVSMLYFHTASVATAQGYAPTGYTQQWQYAMEWVRENTQEDAVFAHWWDYGYWVQSMGERATVLDGGNVIGYWNYLMGRYGITGQTEQQALEFFYSHNVTHFLIDSTDIGKYPAFSSIGSNLSYDRRSWVDTFLKNNQGTYESKNTTAYLYQGQSILDADISYFYNGTRVFLPGINGIALSDVRNVAGVGALIVNVRSDDSLDGAEIIAVYQNQQYRVPVRYAYYKGAFYDFNSGIDAGVYVYPSVQIVNGQAAIDEVGASMFLSSKVVHSQFARLYLYNEPQEGFRLMHSEDNLIVKALKESGATQIHDFIYYQGVQGPIKIWEVVYPEGMQVNPLYLRETFPEGQQWSI